MFNDKFFTVWRSKHTVVPGRIKKLKSIKATKKKLKKKHLIQWSNTSKMLVDFLFLKKWAIFDCFGIILKMCTISEVKAQMWKNLKSIFSSLLTNNIDYIDTNVLRLLSNSTRR